MNVLLLLAHAVAEFDDIRLLTDLGYDVFCPGGYEDPRASAEGMRPALPDVPYHPDLVAACREVREAGGDPGPMIDWAKARIPDKVLDWADVIICHHFPTIWLAGQWDRIREKRVIWRTCGQSDPYTELRMARLQGLEILRYSPKERNLPNFAGETHLIRFYKDPDEWSGWTGEWPGVITVAQGLFDRGEATNPRFWTEATRGLGRPNGLAGPPPPYAMPIGEGSERDGGPGRVGFDEMKDWLRRARCYLYTGTQPASYTLGLIEAMMTGIPVVSIGPGWMQWPDLFEGHELAKLMAATPGSARVHLLGLLSDAGYAQAIGWAGRERAIDLFGKETIGRQWLDYLGQPGRAELHREAVTA